MLTFLLYRNPPHSLFLSPSFLALSVALPHQLPCPLPRLQSSSPPLSSPSLLLSSPLLLSHEILDKDVSDLLRPPTSQGAV